MLAIRRAPVPQLSAVLGRPEGMSKIGRITATLLGLAAAAAAADQKTYTLCKGRVEFSVDTTWRDSIAKPAPDDRAIFLIPNPGPTLAHLGVMATPGDSLEPRVRQLTSAVKVLRRLPLRAAADDVFIFSRDERQTVPCFSVDRYARRGPFIVQVEVKWAIPLVSTAERQTWLVTEANRVTSETTVDGTPIGVVGRLIQGVVRGAALPTLDAQE